MHKILTKWCEALEFRKESTKQTDWDPILNSYRNFTYEFLQSYQSILKQVNWITSLTIQITINKWR